MKRLINLFISLFLMITIIVMYIYFKDFGTDDVVVAVIDSGIDYNHEMLKGNVENGIDFIDFDLDPMDVNGHGTHIAGIILRKEPKAKILNVRILDDRGGGRSFTSLGIMYSLVKGADIVNMSFKEEPNFFTKQMIKLGRSKGVIFIGATGNEKRNEVNFPARISNVLAIGATEQGDNEVYKEGNFGKNTDYLTLGSMVLSTDLANSYTIKSGTSMATANASGIVAYLLTKNNELTEDEIKKILDNSSKELLFFNYLKVLNFEKIKALMEEKPYTEIMDIDFMIKQSEITIPYESINTKGTKVFLNNKLVNEIEDGKGMLTLKLEDGIHELKLVSNEKEKTLKEEIFIVDTKNPIIEVNFLKIYEESFIKVKVEDLTLKDFYINNEKVRSMSNTQVEDNIYIFGINEIKFPIIIKAIDSLDRETKLEINSLEEIKK